MITYGFGINLKTQLGFVPLFDPDLGQLREVVVTASGAVSQTLHFNEPVSSGTYRQTVALLFIPPSSGGGIIGNQTKTVDFINSPPTNTVVIGTDFSIGSDYVSSLDFFQGHGTANIQTARILGTHQPRPTVHAGTHHRQRKWEHYLHLRRPRAGVCDDGRHFIGRGDRSLARPRPESGLIPILPRWSLMRCGCRGIRCLASSVPRVPCTTGSSVGARGRVMERIWEALVAECDVLGGVQWDWQATDGWLDKARFGGAERWARPPRIAGKTAPRSRVLLEGDGGPLGVVIEGRTSPTSDARQSTTPETGNEIRMSRIDSGVTRRCRPLGARAAP